MGSKEETARKMNDLPRANIRSTEAEQGDGASSENSNPRYLVAVQLGKELWCVTILS